MDDLYEKMVGKDSLAQQAVDALRQSASCDRQVRSSVRRIDVS